MDIFRSVLHGFFGRLCSFWYSLKDLFSLHKVVDKAVPDR